LAVIAAICIAIFIVRKTEEPRRTAAGGVVMSGVALSATSDETKV